MSDTILAGDFTVYYLAETRRKQLVWTGSATGTRTVNQVYSALQDLFDELNQMDDGVPMSAQTPTEYTIGIIDAGDKDPWFIDRTSAEHLTGGALKTSSWTRATGTNTGIVRITYTTGTDFTGSDIGKTVTNATSTSSGTLLDYNSTGSTKYAWIRPTDNTSTHDWGGTTGTITVTGGSAASVTQATAAATGESLWANIYSLGTIEFATHLYVYQNAVYLTKYKSTTSDWWGDGHIDILVNVKEVGVEIDEGVVTVFARQYGKTYDDFIVDLTSGGRNPIPLATGSDLNNTTGYKQFTGSAGTGTFNVGNFIYVGAAWASATKRGVITKVAGSGAAPVLDYYLIGDLTDFASSDAVKEYVQSTGADGDATCTAGAPSDVGPATWSTITATFGSYTGSDIDESGTAENYSIKVDLANTYSVAQGYEWSKYVSRRGGVADIDASTQTVTGQFYIGSDYRLVYTGSITGTINEGDTVTQAGTGAKGTITAKNTSAKIIILRNSRGTFNTAGLITASSGGTFTPDSSATALAPIKAAPFGTFAGGTWFGAPGVVFINYSNADANKFQLTDDNGNVIKAPTKVTITVGNTRQSDRIAVFRLTTAGGDIKKNTYNATVQSQAATSVVVGSSVAVDEPGKTAGGVLRLVDASANQEYRLRYTSWTASTFTLAYTNVASAAAGTTTTNVKSTGLGTASLVGDLVMNVTRTNAVAYVTAIVDADNVTISPAITSQTTADNIKFNALPVATTTAPQDTVYIPLIDSFETTGSSGTPGSEISILTYSADIPVRIRARQAGNILPYEADSTVTSSGMSNNIIRTADSIFTP